MYYSQRIAEKLNLTRVKIDNDLVSFLVLQPRNRRKMNLTRVQIDNDLVRFLTSCCNMHLLKAAYEL